MKNESTVKNNEQRPMARSVISAIAISALAATVGLTTACCQGAGGSDVEEDSGSGSN